MSKTVSSTSLRHRRWLLTKPSNIYLHDQNAWAITEPNANVHTNPSIEIIKDFQLQNELASINRELIKSEVKENA